MKNNIKNRHKEIYNLVMGLTDINQTYTLVDCACGKGQIYNLFKNNTNFSVLSYDIDENVVKSCIGKGIPAKQANICSLPIKNNAVNIFVCSETLEHLDKDDFLHAAKEIDRVLSEKGGILLITVPATYDATFENSNKMKHKQYISKELILNSLADYVLLKEEIIYKNQKAINDNSGTRLMVLRKY